MRNFNRSLWLETTPITNYETFRGELKTDVAVIGGGIVGITTAYLLKKAGVRVTLLEANRICEGTTANTTAKITSLHDVFYTKIAENYGKDNAAQYGLANEKAIKKIREIIEENKIDCDFKEQINVIYTLLEENLPMLHEEVRVARSLGLPARFIEDSSLPFDIKGGVCFDNQAQFHPRKYLLALAEKIEGGDCHIFENSRVVDLENEDKGYKIITKEGAIYASNVVVATHFPIFDRYGLYFAKMHAERSYALGLTAPDFPLDGMYKSYENPARSFRTQEANGNQYIILGGEGHRTGEKEDTQECYNNLFEYAKVIYDGKFDLHFKWSAQDMMPLDDIPYIGQYGKNTEGLYVATGFKKWGMSSSMVAAMIITDEIMGKINEHRDIFSARRFELAPSIMELGGNVKEATKNIIAARLNNTTKTLEDLKIGEGTHIIYKGEKVGAYKDEEGRVYIVDIVCKHLGCELHFNDAEKSWDCPCHGSRYTIRGEIIEAPTTEPIKFIQL